MDMHTQSHANPHDQTTNKSKILLLSAEEMQKASDLFKVFADYTRLSIITLLYQRELCVYDVSKFLDLEQSAVSHQLRTLKIAKLVKRRRDGKQIFYSLDDQHIADIFHTALLHIREEKSR